MLIIILIGFSFLLFSEVKIGVINAQKVIQQTSKGKEITARLEKLGQKKQKEVENMRNSIKQLENELNSPALNTQTRDKKNADLLQKRTALKRYIEDAQREMQQKSAKELSNLRKEIMPVIEKIGKARGFTLILDLTTSGIAYFDNTIDITNEVIVAYDKKFAPKK